MIAIILENFPCFCRNLYKAEIHERCSAGIKEHLTGFSIENEYDLAEVRRLLEEMPGIIVQDTPEANVYPMPRFAKDKDEVFVGRLRRDESQPKTLNMWIVADNLRKGAATNAIQIMQKLIEKRGL